MKPLDMDKNRRERNAAVDRTSPELIVPPEGAHIWEWYFDLSDRLQRTKDGVCTPIPPSEFVAWVAATGEIVYPSEYAILGAMDAAYCDETNKELVDYQAREEEHRNKR